MPKERLITNKHLPERWRFRRNAYYYRVPVGDEKLWEGKQEFKLGNTFNEALNTFEKVVSKNFKLDETHTFLSEEEIINNSIKLPVTSGVYFLIKDYKVIYVGQSKNIFSGVHKHKNINFDSVSFLPTEEEHLTLIASKYISLLNPEKNEDMSESVGQPASMG